MRPEFLPGNRLKLLNSGSEYFPQLVAAIREARHEVHLESYIFEDDATGREVIDAMIGAAQRGVIVRVLVDGFGAREFASRLQPMLVAGGVQAMVYRPEISSFHLRRHRLRRLHRKLAVIDGRIAFVGGINVIDDLNNPERMPPRFDYAVRVEGPLLQPIQKTLYRLWELVVWARLRRRYRLISRVLRARPEPVGNQKAAFLVRDNIRHRRDIELAYLSAISAARRHVLLANAYFLPGRRFRRALRDASRRGVRVVVLVQGRVEYRLQHYATQALYDRLLHTGIRIFEYRRSFLHAKVAVIDDHWATVGSSNIDPFSLLLAREANIVVDDEEFARELRASLEGAMATGAREVPIETWRRVPWYQRVLHWASYGLVRFLIGISGYGGKR